ncbi:MAG: MMPL family transporter [Proteobacteria bacterium]|nr:MMPL family transporter [Pseudomonadota bacterium]
MKRFEKAFGEWVLRYRWPIIILSLLFVAMAATGGKNIYFTTNYRVFFSEDNPQLLEFEALENTYVQNDNVFFVLEPADGNVFTQETLSAVAYLTERAWQIPFSNRVDSITNFQYTEAMEDDLIVRDLVEDAFSLNQKQLGQLRETTLNEPLLHNRLISDKAHVTGINVNVQLPRINEDIETPEVVQFSRELAREFEIAYPNIKVRLTGMVMMNNAFSESAKNDIANLVPISFAVMLLLLAVLVGGITGTFCTLLVIASSILVAMGIGGYIGFPISPPSATFPTIILTIAIANCVHILATFLHDMRQGMSKHKALIESLRINLQPVFLASLTTAIGFLMMNFSDVPPFRHLGNFVAIGVVVSFIMSVTFLPALISLLPVKVTKKKDDRDRLMEKLGDFVVRRRSILFWGMCGLILVLLTGLPRNQLNDVFVHYFDETIDFRVDSDFTTDNLTGIYNIEYSLDSGEPGGISNPEYLKDVEAFANWSRQQPEILHVNTYTDIIKRLNKNMHGDDPAMYKIPQERNLSAQYLLLYEMSLPYGLDLNNQINVDKSAIRFTTTLKTLSSNELISIEERAEAWLINNAPHIKSGHGTGTSLMFAHIGKRNIISMLYGTTLALILISLVLIIALRSFKIGLVSLIPNLVPAAMGFGLWGYLVGEIGLSLSVVSTMTLGIVVDDTVHFLSKYLRARREKHLNPEDAVRYAFATVGRALLITSIVLVAGFLILATSAFQLNSGMGLLTAIVIILALLADFLFLPPLLIKMEEKFDAKKLLSANTAADSTAT